MSACVSPDCSSHTTILQAPEGARVKGSKDKNRGIYNEPIRTDLIAVMPDQTGGGKKQRRCSDCGKE